MYGFIEKDSDLKIEDAVYDEVLNAGLGWMHELKKGQTFRILDIEGNQAVDTTFYDLENPEDHYGAVQTLSLIHILHRCYNRGILQRYGL